MSTVALPEPVGARPPRALDRALTALIVALAVAFAIGLGLRLAGLTALVDYTDSMRPAIAAGDVVIDRGLPAGELRPGQVASLRDPADGRLITHRVVSVVPQGERVAVVTRGDANDATERWMMDRDAPVKRMVARVPWVGHVLVWLASPALRSVLLLSAAAGFLVFGLLTLRRR